MATYKNVTYDDRDPHLQYQSWWFLTGTWNASSTGESGTLTTSNLLDANVTFVFPEAAKAFYYYGMRRSQGARFGICIDCDPNQRNFNEIDALNATDDGKNPPSILFSQQFDSPGVHEIILKNMPDTRFSNNNSQISVDRFVLEVERDDVTTQSTTSASESPSSTVVPASNTSSKSVPVGAIAGAVVGGVIGLLVIVLGILLCLRRRKRWKDKDSQFSLSPFVPPETSETRNQPPLAAGATPLSLVNQNRRETDAGRIDEDGDILPPDYDQVFAPVEDSPMSPENQPPFDHRSALQKSAGPVSLPDIPSNSGGPARHPSFSR